MPVESDSTKARRAPLRRQFQTSQRRAKASCLVENPAFCGHNLLSLKDRNSDINVRPDNLIQIGRAFKRAIRREG